jgi:hypothetical protein
MFVAALVRLLSLERLDQVDGHDHKLTAHIFAHKKRKNADNYVCCEIFLIVVPFGSS